MKWTIEGRVLRGASVSLAISLGSTVCKIAGATNPCPYRLFWRCAGNLGNGDRIEVNKKRSFEQKSCDGRRAFEFPAQFL